MRPPKVAIDIQLRLPELAFVEDLDEEQLRGAMENIASDAVLLAQGLWVQHASDLNIRESGRYIAGIQAAEIRQVSAGDEIAYEIINNAPHADIVEDGHAAFSLPDRIDWSGPNVKRTAKGKPYLNIPLRHTAYQSPAQLDASGATHAMRSRMMPRDISRAASGLTRTHKHNAGRQYKPNGDYRAADTYTWGGRLSHSAPIGTDARRDARTVGVDAQGQTLSNPAWQNSKFDGMFKSGEPGHTEYLTIRTVTPDSKGWRIPAQTGHGVARAVAAMLNSADGQAEFDGIVAARLQGVLP